MKQFLSRHEDRITGVLSGFDRLVFRGTLRHISYTDGMGKYLSYQKILLKEFAEFALQRTSELKQALYQQAERLERPVVYLESSRKNKEAIARKIAQQDNVRSGLIAVLSCVEPCITFSIRRNRQKKRLELVQSLRKCLNFYHYCMDPIFGFMHAPRSRQPKNSMEWLHPPSSSSLGRSGRPTPRRYFPWRVSSARLSQQGTPCLALSQDFGRPSRNQTAKRTRHPAHSHPPSPPSCQKSSQNFSLQTHKARSATLLRITYRKLSLPR